MAVARPLSQTASSAACGTGCGPGVGEVERVQHQLGPAAARAEQERRRVGAGAERRLAGARAPPGSRAEPRGSAPAPRQAPTVRQPVKPHVGEREVERGAHAGAAANARTSTTRSKRGSRSVVVGDGDERRARRAALGEQQVEDQRLVRRVEVAGRLVGEDERAGRQQAPGDGDALPLALATAGRGSARACRRCRSPRPAPRRGRAVRRVSGVAGFSRAGCRMLSRTLEIVEEREVLEHEADAADAEGAPRASPARRSVDAVHPISPASGERMPAIRFSSVVLPLPLGPATARCSPRATSSAGIASAKSPPGKAKRTSRSRIIRRPRSRDRWRARRRCRVKPVSFQAPSTGRAPGRRRRG